MKAKDIEKALECCNRVNNMDCHQCPFEPRYGADCFITILKASLAYINRLKAENAILVKETDRLGCVIEDLSETIKEYEAELAKR